MDIRQNNSNIATGEKQQCLICFMDWSHRNSHEDVCFKEVKM